MFNGITQHEDLTAIWTPLQEDPNTDRNVRWILQINDAPTATNYFKISQMISDAKHVGRENNFWLSTATCQSGL
jgi:hypothetical protein